MSDDSIFTSLARYVAALRLVDLMLSPDGRRLVATVQSLSADAKEYVTSLWAIDPEGGPARRLTQSAAGEKDPAFLADGDLLFLSKRAERDAPGGERGEAEEETLALWRLPAGGGEAACVLRRPGGISHLHSARAATALVVRAPVLHGAADQDAERRAARRSGAVSAVLHETLPVRHWDRDLGPAQDRLMAVEMGEGDTAWSLRDLTPDAGHALVETGGALSADGRTVFTGWRVNHARARVSSELAAIDVETGERRVLARRDDDPADQHDYDSPAPSPDGRFVVVVDERAHTPERCPTTTLLLVDLETGEGRDLLADFPLWPATPVVAADSTSVFFTADQEGHVPAWRVEVASGACTRLSASGSYSHLCPSPDGRFVYALRSHIDSPPRPVRLDARAPDQEPVFLDAPGDVGALPGHLEEVEATAPDGARVRAFLALPDSADGPAPLLLWVHGGPLMSWNSWSWRWNPWLMVARGYAVLLPDPGLSRGYGDEFVQRAWGKWGPVPYGDLMAVTDATLARGDIDAGRTAAMGGSYGGYMANWIAGHTDRFRAIVTHASLWSLRNFMVTTDSPGAWATEWGYPDESPERYALNDPCAHADAIATPMLVIHGDRDYRVPIGEGLALWTDLVRRGLEAKFLYFPNEGHWILRPGNIQVWYETIWAFLDHHVRGGEWVRPALV